MPCFLSSWSAVCNKFYFHEKERKGKSEVFTFVISVWIEHTLISMLGRKQKSKLPFSFKKVEKKLWVSKRHYNSKILYVLLPRNRNIWLFWSSWPELAVELNYDYIRCQLIHSIVFERRWNIVVHANQNGEDSH